MTPDASIVIPTLQGGDRFAQVVEAVVGQSTGRNVERWIIDSGSTDQTLDLARKAGFSVLSVPRREFNHGATRDRALQQTRAPFAVLLVQDAVPVDEHWLDALVDAVAEDDQAAGGFSRQLPIPGGNPILDERLRGWIAGMDEARRAHLGDQDWDALDPIARLHLVAFDNVSSCVKRSVWESHPFGHQPFGEDLNWSSWAIRQGHAIRFEPKSVVEHSHDRSAWYETKRIYCDHRNLHRLLGLHAVQSLSQVRQARGGSLAHYRQVLENADLSPTEFDRRWDWAKKYSWGELVAQWLAPKVNLAGESGLWGWLDRRIRRGV